MTQARNEQITEQTRELIAEMKKLGLYHSIELPDGQVIPGLQSVERMRKRLTYFHIPEDLAGKRVLDIGAWDGWFSFEMERRGASVVALDYVTTPQFLEAKKLIGSKVEAVNGDICNVDYRDLGYFDIVIFMGVLYHVKHPVRALENVCSMTRDMACIESYVIDDGSDLNAMPIMEFYEGQDLRGQFDNWVGPNCACMMAMARTAGFAKVQFEGVFEGRGHFSAWRQWHTEPGVGAAPRILSAEHSVDRDRRFSTREDDYVSIWFKGAPELTCDNVYVEIGPYAARPASIHTTGSDGWVAGCKLPPGITAGWQEVKLRTEGTAFSNTVRIPVDVTGEDPLKALSAEVASAAAMPEVFVVTDGRKWTEWAVEVGADTCLSLWLKNAPEHWGVRDFDVLLLTDAGELRFTPVFVSPYDERQLKQVNILLPPDLAPGRVKVCVEREWQRTPAVEVQLVPKG